jgi:hypothetical protein
MRSQENYYQQATYEDKVPTFSKPSATLIVQETDCLNAYIATRSAYHTMSILKSVPEGLKPQECEHVKLHEPLPVPYVPTRDKVQDEVAKLRNLEIKTTIKKDTTLNFPVWHKNGTCKAFLMHVTAVLNAIQKRGHFNN